MSPRHCPSVGRVPSLPSWSVVAEWALGGRCGGGWGGCAQDLGDFHAEPRPAIRPNIVLEMQLGRYRALKGKCRLQVISTYGERSNSILLAQYASILMGESSMEAPLDWA